MKSYLKRFSASALTILSLIAVSFYSCSDDDDATDNTAGSYAIHGNTPNNTARFVLETSSLTSGVASAVGAGADVTTFGNRPNNLIVKDGFYYNLNTNNGRFGKYKFENGVLTTVTEIPFSDFIGIRSSNWIDDNTLLISGENPSETAIAYAIIDVSKMTISSKGAFPLPASPVDNYIIQAGTTIKRGNRLFVGYSYYENDNAYAILKKVYVTAIDYPGMTNPVHFMDDRSAGAGGGSNMSWSSVESNGDIYLMSCPSDMYGVSDQPTAILRIKSGEEKFDATYFFNLSSKVSNDDPLTMTPLGNGKFITRNGRQDLIKTYSDFTAGFIYEYYVGDVTTQTLNKLNTPLHKGLFNNVLLDNNNAYFVDNSETSGAFVYEYTIADGSTTKGLEIQGLDVVNWVARVN